MTPRPRPLPAPREPIATIIVVDHPHQTAWAARVEPFGLTHESFAPHPLTPAETAAEVTAWLREHAPAGVKLHVHHTPLREHLAGEGFVTEEVEVLPVGSWAAARHAGLTGDVERNDAAANADTSTIYAASDASVHKLTGSAAYAWVTSQGYFRYGKALNDTNKAEITAIVKFANWLRRKQYGRDAVLFVDSRNAIKYFRSNQIARESWGNHDERVKAWEMIRAGTIRLVWVRGHNDHPLNDLADRLALLVQRNRWLGQGGQELRAHAERIVADALAQAAGTDWTARVDNRRQAAA